MKVYFISGLGADRRIFRHIQLPNGFEAVHLDWIKPMQNESLHNYAVRLAERIDANEEFMLAGLSMGGMIAVEIARLHPPAMLILFSSISCSAHLPFYYRTAGRLRLHRVVPISLLKSASFIKRYFTTEKNEDKKLISQLIRETDPAFIRWALHAIITWDCRDFQGQTLHIHGGGDMLLPIRFTKPTHIIPKAGHMMVMTEAREINTILAEALKKYISTLR